MTIREKITDNAMAYGELLFWVIALGVIMLVNLPYEYIYHTNAGRRWRLMNARSRKPNLRRS